MTIRRIALMGALLTVPLLLQGSVKNPADDQNLAQKVRHELVMLPYYNVFDNLAFSVRDGEVTLTGQVLRPTLKSDAENVVKRIPGVTSVKNELTVLPLSGFDNHIRWALLRAIYGQAALQRYAMGPIPSIHLIVNNGNVTLEGVVGSEMDRNIAYLQANSVPGVFSVTNNLRVAGKNG